MTPLEENRQTLENEMVKLRGAELVRKLAQVIAEQNQKIESLTATVKLLNAFEENRDLLLNIEEPVSAVAHDLAQSYEVQASEYLPMSEGFHEVEFCDNGKPFRWAGAEGTLEFVCHVNRVNGCLVQLELLKALDPKNISDLEMFDGDARVPLAVDTTRYGTVLTAEIPATEQTGGPTHLVFRFPVFRELSETDGRIAAVAFQGLRVVSRDAKGARK